MHRLNYGAPRLPRCTRENMRNGMRCRHSSSVGKARDFWAVTNPCLRKCSRTLCERRMSRPRDPSRLGPRGSRCARGWKLSKSPLKPWSSWRGRRRRLRPPACGANGSSALGQCNPTRARGTTSRVPEEGRRVDTRAPRAGTGAPGRHTGWRRPAAQMHSAVLSTCSARGAHRRRCCRPGCSGPSTHGTPAAAPG